MVIMMMFFSAGLLQHSHVLFARVLEIEFVLVQLPLEILVGGPKSVIFDLQFVYALVGFHHLVVDRARHWHSIEEGITTPTIHRRIGHEGVSEVWICSETT